MKIDSVSTRKYIEFFSSLFVYLNWQIHPSIQSLMSSRHFLCKFYPASSSLAKLSTKASSKSNSLKSQQIDFIGRQIITFSNNQLFWMDKVPSTWECESFSVCEFQPLTVECVHLSSIFNRYSVPWLFSNVYLKKNTPPSLLLISFIKLSLVDLICEIILCFHHPYLSLLHLLALSQQWIWRARVCASVNIQTINQTT